MRLFKVLALTALTSISILAARPAHAGLLLEPYLGYELGKLESVGANYDLSTAAIGARVGITFPLLFVAVDYMTPLGGSLKQDDAAGTKWDVSGGQLFADVGVSLPLIRAYAGYGLSTELTGKNGALENKYEGGTAFKLGVGTTIFPMTSINLEYLNTSYDKVNGVTASGRKSNFYMLSLSVPFNLM